jgi:CubicO group peptidase (beta-lactamase class C family)
MADSDTITGLVEPGFDAVRDAFARNFELGRERGAAFCAHIEGRKVVDLYGGAFDGAGTRPYGPEALQLVFSTTKGATAICANLLAQRGLLDMDAPVSAYWPEFAQAGKGSMPVRFLLCHQAGVPAIDRRLSPEELQAWTPVAEALAEQAPFWEPGTAHGYHASPTATSSERWYAGSRAARSGRISPRKWPARSVSSSSSGCPNNTKTECRPSSEPTSMAD